MGDLPKINGKIGKKFPNRGERGGGRGSPTWEKFPHFPVFFWQTSLMKEEEVEIEGYLSLTLALSLFLPKFSTLSVVLPWSLDCESVLF